MSNYNQLNEDASQNQSANQEQQILNAGAGVDQVNQGGEYEMQPIKKVNPRDYLPDPRIQKKKKALSLQAQKKLVEEQNKKDIEMAILKRIIFRIFIFFVYIAFLVLGFIAIYLYLAYIKSQTTMPLKSNLTMNIDACMMTIYDDSTLGDTMKITFSIPGNFDPWLGESSSLVSEVSYDDSGVATYSYTMHNILTMESCQISLYVGSGPSTINNFEFNCIEEGTCVLVSYAKNLTIGNMTTVKGTEIYLNMLNINTSAFEFIATSGLAQFNHFAISQASSINLTSGNIILQSTGDYIVNWTSGNPSYCISAPVLSDDYSTTGCERVRINKYGELVVADASDANSTNSTDDSDSNDTSDEDTSSSRLLAESFLQTPKKSLSSARNHKKAMVKTPHHLSDSSDDSSSDDTTDDSTDETDTTDDSDDSSSDEEIEEITEELPDSCWGRVALCADGSESCSSADSSTLPVLYVRTGTGAIYANIIPEVGLPAAESNANLKSVIYDDGTVGWSVSTLLDLTTDYDDSQADTVFDPVFLVKIGSKEANSSLFQQWVVTYAPAYAYVRPWWIGTYSLTLLSTSTYEIQADLNPGFCPYTPGLSQDRLYLVQDMLTQTFLNESEGVFSFTYPSDIDMPPTEIDYNTTNYGFREVPSTVGDEYWVSITKENSTTYDYTYEDLSQSSTIEAAVILAAVIGVLVGIYLVIGAVYGIISVYIDIIDIVTSTSKYSKIEQKDDPGAYQPLMYTKKGKALQAALKTNEEVPSISYNPLDMFRQLFVLAPPMSAFVDFLCVYMSKKYINSAEVFFTLLFVEHNSADDDEELHDLEKERISGTEMKTLYEKFCYLNGYLEQKLDDDDVSSLMDSTYGFKIVTKNDSQTLYYTKVMLLDEELPKIGKDKDKTLSSMLLFIQNCCKVSKFDTDCVPVSEFTSQYKSFCMINYLNVETPTLSDMSNKYSIGNNFLTQQWIVRSSSEAQTKAKTGSAPGGDDAAAGAGASGSGDGAAAGGDTAAAGAGDAAATGSNANAAGEKKATGDSTENQGCIAKIKAKFSSVGSMKTKKLYYLDRKRLNNHFYLLMQLPEKIETQEELAVANKELIMFPGWMVVDLFTVLFHIITILILMAPVLGFFLLENVLYSDFSLSPDKDLITTEDITDNIWGLPVKLYSSSLWIQILILIVLIFWGLGFIDLLYYYMKMEFPQDKFFRKTRASEAAFMQILFRRMMWVLVLISLWVLGSYIALAMVWMILGAVINPTAFLPYAAGASTFVTVVTTKYNEFMNLAENGLKKVIEYIKSLTQTELNDMLKKMGLSSDSGSSDSSGSAATVSSDTVTTVADQATKLGLADQVTADPKTDPAGYVKELKEKMQSKVKDYMKEKFDKILVKKDKYDDLSAIKENFVTVVIDIMKQDSSQLKTDLHDLLYNLNQRGVIRMPEGLISLLWEFAFIQDPTSTSEDFLMTIVDPIASFMLDLLLDQGMSSWNEFNKDILSKIINIVQSLQNNDASVVVTHLNVMIEKVWFFQGLKKYNTLMKIAISLLDGNKLNYHQVFKLLRDFLKEMELESEIVDFFELMLNSFNHQTETPTIREMNVTIEKFVRKTVKLEVKDRNSSEYREKYKIYKEEVRNISYNLTMLFAFLYHQFEDIPKEILRNVIGLMQKDLPSYFPDEKYFKNLVPVLQAGYETVGCFLEEPNSIIKKFENNASAFGIPLNKARQLKVLSTIKYKELYPGKEIYTVQSTQLWKDIISSLQIDKRLLIGLFGFVTLRFEDIKEINDLVVFMLKLGKVDVEQRSKVLDIFKLYASDSESDISTSATNLGIPREFVPLILIAKRILDPKFVTDLEWIELGIDYKDTLLDERYAVFNDEKKFEKWRQDVAGKLEKVNDKIMEGNDDGPAKKTLLLLNCKGIITKQKIKDDLDTLSTNKNKIAQFTEYQFDLLTSMVNSRAINRDSTSSFDSDSKAGIVELAKAINLEEPKLDKLLTLWFLTKPDKIYTVLKEFSPEFIEEGEEENYENYISYVYSKINEMAVKEKFAKEEFAQIFGVNIPPVILNKSLFNPNAVIDLNTMYEMLSFPLKSLITVDEKGQSNYRNFDECLISMAPLVKYLTSHMEVQHIMLIRKIFNIEHEGIADLLMILNETSQTNSLSLFLDHVDKYCGEAMKFFVALLAFFQGKSNNVEILNDELKKVSVRTYLSDFIYPELLDALYALFMQEASEYSEYLIKLFRRVEACKATNLGTTSLQSLVKIPGAIIENFLKLVNGEDYNAQVLSKELGLSSEAIEFGSGLTRIMNASQIDKPDIITSVCSNSDFKSALSKINVKTSELLTLFKLCYGCYDNDDIRWIIDSLCLDKDLIGDNESIIKSLLAMDQVLDISADYNKNWATLQKKMSIAEPLLESNAMRLDKDLVSLASFLLHGDFTLILKLNSFPQYGFLFPKYPEILPDYQEFLMGLCGTISHRVQKFSINTLFRQYYKNLQKGIQPTDPDYMTPNSSRSYAVFCLYKSLDISPIWTFLYLGDIDVWGYIWDVYYENTNYKDPFLNPLIILMIIVNYIETPTAFKEIMYDNEYLTNYCAFLKDPTFKGIQIPNPQKSNTKQTMTLDHTPEVIEESWKGYRGTSKGLCDLLWANWAKSKEKLEELCKTHLCSEIIDYWPERDINFNDNMVADALKRAALMSIRKKFTQEENKEIDDFCKEAANSPYSLETFLSYYENGSLKDQIIGLLENIFPEIIKNVINSVSEILEDPRDNEPEEDEKKKKDLYDIPRIQKHFEDRNGNEFTMCALATIVEIRNGYFNLHDCNDRGEDHYKLFTYKLDVLLSMIEKNNFHKNFMNSFSKYRVMQLVGLSAGFCIRGEHMIRGNVTSQFNDYEFQKKYANVVNMYKTRQNKIDFYLMVEKLKRIWEILSDYKKARENRYFRVYNLGVLETAIENENYYEINTEPENIIYQSYPGHNKFKWAPFVYDVMTCNSLMDYNEDDFYFDNDVIASRTRYVVTSGSKGEKFDLRSGQEWKEVFQHQNNWNNLFVSEEFALLVSIFRGNYSGITESNTYFTIKCPEMVPYLYGLLGLNASANFIDENNSSVCESYITAIGTFMTSNRKSLNEIVKFLYGHAETIKKFSASFGDNEQVFEKFMMLSASTLMSFPDIQSAEFLISKISGLTALEIDVFKKILEVSLGVTSYLDELITFSNKNKGLTTDAAKALSNLVNNLDIYSLRSEASMTPEFFNLRDKTTYSISMQKNSFSFYLELFKIASFQFPDSVSDNIKLINVANCDMFGDNGDPEDRTRKQISNNEKKGLLNLLFSVVNNMLDGDFSIFFMLSSSSEDFFKILRILNLANNADDLKSLRVIASLKPNKLSAKLIKSKPENLDIETRAKEFKEMNVICLPEGLENKDVLEGKLSSLILGIQYWNIVEILNGLDNETGENAELYCLLQSFFVWKNMSPILSHWNELQDKTSKSFVEPKVIANSLKVFLGKILQTIRKIVQQKKNKKGGGKSPTKPGAGSQIESADDSNYLSILREVKGSPLKLTHAFVNQLNQYKQKMVPPHFLDWLMSMGAVFPKGVAGNDPISKVEPYFTGRFLKKIGKDPNMTFTVNFCLQSYTILFEKKKAMKNIPVEKDKKPEESAQQSIGPLANVLSLPTAINLLNPDGVVVQPRKNNLMNLDLFMRLSVVLQKKSKSGKPTEEVLVAALGVFKLVLKQIQNLDIDLVYSIVNLLTGYNISGNQISSKKSTDLVKTFYHVMEKAFADNDHVRKFVTTDVLTKLNKYLANLAQFNIKSITDPKFQSTIIDMLCAITGTDRDAASKADKEKTTKGKGGKSAKKLADAAKKTLKNEEGKEKEEEEKAQINLLFDLPIDVIEAVFKIVQFDTTYIETLLMKIEGCDAQKIRIFTKMKEHAASMSVYGKTATEETLVAKPKAGESELAEIIKKIQNGTATTHEVFVATDREGDSSGSISKQEFSALARRLNINLTDHRVNEIFASLKKGGSGTNDEELTEDEFASALQYLHQKSTNMTLEALGISKSMLMVALVSLVIILLLLFVFIFLGIQGFAVGSSFGSVVNSMLPMGAGAGVGGGKDEEKEKKTSDETVGSAVEKSKTILQSNSV